MKIGIKVLAILLLVISTSALAAPLRSIDINDWSATYSRVAPRIPIKCDCALIINPDGTALIQFSWFRSIRKVGNEITCIVGSPADFLQATATGMSLMNALLLGGGASWTSQDNGVTWWRMLPGEKVQEAPDDRCFQ